MVELFQDIPNAFGNVKIKRSLSMEQQSAQQQRLHGHRKYAAKKCERMACKCGRTFIYLAQYEFHKRWECGRKMKCTNEKCGKTFTTMSNLRYHLKTCKGENVVMIIKDGSFLKQFYVNPKN